MAKEATINVRLSAVQKEKLAILAEQQDRSIGQVIRLAIDGYIARREEK